MGSYISRDVSAEEPSVAQEVAPLEAPKWWSPLPAGYCYVHEAAGDSKSSMQLAVYRNEDLGFVSQGSTTSRHGSALIRNGAGTICAHRDMESGIIQPFRPPGGALQRASQLPQEDMQLWPSGHRPRRYPLGKEYIVLFGENCAKTIAKEANEFNSVFYPQRLQYQTLTENPDDSLFACIDWKRGDQLWLFDKNTNLFAPASGYEFVVNHSTGKPAIFNDGEFLRSYLLVAAIDQNPPMTKIVGRVVLKWVSSFELDLSAIEPYSAYAELDDANVWHAYAAADAALIAPTAQFIQDHKEGLSSKWNDKCADWEAKHLEQRRQ